MDPTPLGCERPARRRGMARLAMPVVAPGRGGAPARDGCWDDYAYEIDPAFAAVADDMAQHRAERVRRAGANGRDTT